MSIHDDASLKPVKPVALHYDAVAAKYHVQYQASTLHNLKEVYPANYFRLQILLNSFMSKGVTKVIEVGVGEGTPLATLAQAGIEVFGFDYSEEMVHKSRAQMKKLGLDENQICWGDVQDPLSYATLLRHGPFDGLVAMGVMPHVENDVAVLDNMTSLVKPGGSVFIEFRNKLFSLFTMNRYTYEFIMDDLLAGVSPSLKDELAKELKKGLRMDIPAPRTTMAGVDAPGYDAILSKFHNPFEVVDLFKEQGFKDIKTHWYHYHPTLPRLESADPAEYRKESIRLEHESSGWRGLFLCSAFVIEAVKQ